MPSPKLYRSVPVASLPDPDWVASQSVPAGVPNVYSLWTQRDCIEMIAAWWGAGGAVTTQAGTVTLQPVEVKSVPDNTALPGVPAHKVVANAAGSVATATFLKRTLVDTSGDEMYVRVAAVPTPPAGATHLRLYLEVTD